MKKDNTLFLIFNTLLIMLLSLLLGALSLHAYYKYLEQREKRERLGWPQPADNGSTTSESEGRNEVD